MVDVVIGARVGFRKQELSMIFSQESLYGFFNQNLKLGLCQMLSEKTTLALQAGVSYSNLYHKTNYNYEYGVYGTHVGKDLTVSLNYTVLYNSSSSNESEFNLEQSGFLATSLRLSSELKMMTSLVLVQRVALGIGLLVDLKPDVKLLLAFSPQNKSFGVFGYVKIKTINLGLGLSYQTVLGVSTSLLASYVD